VSSEATSILQQGEAVCLQSAPRDIYQTMNEALIGVKKEDIELVKQVFQRVYDNLT
jgi:hypothetical protein